MGCTTNPTLIPHGCDVANCPDGHMLTVVDGFGGRVCGVGGCRAAGMGSLGSPGRRGGVMAAQPGCGAGSGRWRILSMAVARACDQGQWRGRRSHLCRCPRVSLAGTASIR